MKRWLFALMWILGSSVALGADLSGTWLAKGLDSSGAVKTVTLLLTVDGATITGTLEGVQDVMNLTGTLMGDSGEGTVTNSSGTAYFKFIVATDTLNLTLANLDANGKPLLEAGVLFALKRPEGPKAAVSFQVAGFGTPPSAAAPTDPLLGAWITSGLRLELSGKDGKYTGIILIGKVKAPVTVTGSASSLKGSFKLGKIVKNFTARLEGGKLVLVLDGKKYVLAKK
jgi:hypothetical protein